MIYQGKTKAPVREVVLHCAAIRQGQFDHMTPFQVYATINRWHVERGFFNGFGYHGLFMPDGEYRMGRPFHEVGAHVQGRNTGTIGLLLIESATVTKVADFATYFTDAQGAALRALLASLRGINKVTGHNDYANKLCPGFKVKTEDWL